MPAYAQLQTFMQFVRAANPTFERVKTSSLRPLVNVLSNAAGNANQVCQAINALPADKVNRYLDALYFLLATYPGLPANAAANLHPGPLNKTNAALYTQTPVPPNFHPSGPQAGRVFLTPPSALQNMTLEQFILNHHATTGILLIHLSDHDPGMDLIFNGRSTMQHMNSVLRVARLKGCDLCVLTMKANADVCPGLLNEYNQFVNRVRVLEPLHHMGSHDASFRNFAAAHANVVVMGFDACVCVFANVFGADETMPGPAGGYRPPLASLTNVVMSRAALVTGGTITSMSASMGAAEYGPLFNT